MFIQGIRPLNNTNSHNYNGPAFGINPMAVGRGTEKGFNPALITDAIAKKAPTIEYKMVNGKYCMVIENPKKLKIKEPKNYTKEIRKLDSEDKMPKKDTNTSDDDILPNYDGIDISGFDPSPNPFSWDSIQYDM